jgi:hypothetical protein
MDKTDKEVLELCKAWFEDIMERSNRLTTGNVSHGSRAIHGAAKNYIEYIDEHLKNTWKPSKEQMKQLKSAANIFPDSRLGHGLKSLYEDLKKLTEE